MPFKSGVCSGGAQFGLHGAAEAVYWGLLAAISALRVYALSGRDWRLSALVFVLLIVRIVYQIAATVYIASLASSSAADAIVFIITWRCTYHVIRLARQENIKASLSSLLLRDDAAGTIYFALLFIMNCLCIVTYLLEVFTGLSYLAIALSSIVLSRLLLNLLEASLSADSVSRSLDGGTASSDIRFSRGVDVFGATLSLDQDYDDEDDAAGPGGEPTADEDEDPRSFEE
ncbi:hypothetical protein DAEQUDRAFT_798175 [Daedalea quercina L-15889]|uniref:Uncharacterized protein n=1 Tax=Daedalea quercina L-15889 TaxID=1314783 RepID=A0A165MVD8_9APHY|nr:hypothetical protein DAEQUDRAFT_798175 [Daedalea quercina L-15889]